MPLTIRIHPDDNVAVALQPIPRGPWSRWKGWVRFPPPPRFPRAIRWLYAPSGRGKM